jgi:hypothetical protein
MRLVVLVPATPDSTTSLIKSLTICSAGDFRAVLALIGAFRDFGIAETFFFSIVPTDFT